MYLVRDRWIDVLRQRPPSNTLITVVVGQHRYDSDCGRGEEEEKTYRMRSERTDHVDSRLCSVAHSAVVDTGVVQRPVRRTTQWRSKK